MTPPDMPDAAAARLAAMAMQVEAENRAVYGRDWRRKLGPAEAAFLALMDQWELYEAAQ